MQTASPRGGYVFLPGSAAYSLGARAQPGYRIERLQLRMPIALESGFALIEHHLKSIGRPKAALVACELRSPAPVSAVGFGEFNRAYVEVLDNWGLLFSGKNPVARSNVCPAAQPPAGPALHAFSYTVVDAQAGFPDFFIAGVAESRPGAIAPEDRIVAYRDNSPDGLRLKVRHVVASIDSRLQALNLSWRDVTAIQGYTCLNVQAILAEEMVSRSQRLDRVAWHACLPPVVDLAFELDCRSVSIDTVER